MSTAYDACFRVIARRDADHHVLFDDLPVPGNQIGRTGAPAFIRGHTLLEKALEKVTPMLFRRFRFGRSQMPFMALPAISPPSDRL